MYFSEKYGIDFRLDQNWFDPFLNKDCRVFIDPLLVYENSEPEFRNAQKKVTDFFVDAFALVKKSVDDTHNKIKRKKALRALSFHEVEELCLGHAKESTKGRGTGARFAEIIFEALKNQLSASVNINKKFAFETIALFAENIGADRISDMIATILKEEIIAYTQRICNENNIPTVRLGVRAAKYNFERHAWQDGYYSLPPNEYNSPKGVLLVPKEFLRANLSIDQIDFKNFLLDTKDNEELREEFGIDIMAKVKMNAAKVTEISKKGFKLLKDYIAHVISEVRPYDFEKDEKGLYRIDRDAKQLSMNFTAIPSKIETMDEFKKIVLTFCEDLKNCIESGKSLPLLWVKDKPRKEKFVQALFSTAGVFYGKQYNLDISPEPSTGRGLIDFKVSQGHEFRALIEIKLVSNTAWANGLEHQLPEHLEAEQVKNGYFVLVAFNDKEKEKFQSLPRRLDEINKKYQGKLEIKTITVDASKKPTASIKQKASNR
ncbi:MAG: hypothetical protein JW772_02920 [Candidatus Diapherotrites archaeon]|nr:hypothetical protein [Candidatus Diapherotrites archaeon]